MQIHNLYNGNRHIMPLGRFQTILACLSAAVAGEDSTTGGEERSNAESGEWKATSTGRVESLERFESLVLSASRDILMKHASFVIGDDEEIATSSSEWHGCGGHGRRV